MPIWLQILIQVVETALQVILKNPPAIDAPTAEHEAHAVNVAKLENALTHLKT